ncbi:uncharacterized protein LOC110882468 [Helianthus annuus]|uniref:uncharacterized protein LOC110882468 n=1 Tax=Helianthus annuus TaxID=4232 RepID=UPI000B8F9771|nr:uncharacterized protein LOC110882468 [Helianthus annuus]
MDRFQGKNFYSKVYAKLGDGKFIQFWIDNWCGMEALRIRCPNLFKLERKKRCKLADRIKQYDGNWELAWDWTRIPSSEVERQELETLLGMMEGRTLSFGRDSWCWNWTGQKDSDFSVRALKKAMVEEYQQVGFVMYWIKWVPIKCSINAWRAACQRIPTKTELRRRDVLTGSVTCSMCEDQDETVEHLFTGCVVAMEVWARIAAWCKIPPIYAFDVKDLLELYKTVAGNKKRKKIIHGIIIASMWAIWLARNDKVFNRKETKAEVIVEKIKANTFWWFKNRISCNNFVWNEWWRNSMYLM